MKAKAAAKQTCNQGNQDALIAAIKALVITTATKTAINVESTKGVTIQEFGHKSKSAEHQSM